MRTEQNRTELSVRFCQFSVLCASSEPNFGITTRNPLVRDQYRSILDQSSNSITCITKPTYHLIVSVHFSELSTIWENDRRMPSRASRAACSLAPNLNLLNVNRQWYLVMNRMLISHRFIVQSEELPMRMYAGRSDGSDSGFSYSGDSLVNLSSSTRTDLVFSSNLHLDLRIHLQNAYLYDRRRYREL